MQKNVIILNRKYHFIFLLILLLVNASFGIAQISLSSQSQINTVCNGNGCNYSGPSILINEVMLVPATGNGSIYGDGPNFPSNTNEGEWLELYNPDKCLPVDISCYFLGNNTDEASLGYYDLGGGYAIPQGTIVPPMGFVVLRGENAPAVPSNLLVQNGGKTIEIVANNISRICLDGGYRLWFPDAGGWFAFYNSNGVPQDAISWNSQTNSNMNASPCIPASSGCPFTGTLAPYNNIPAANRAYIASSTSNAGQSFRRIPDGGAWQINASAAPTMGTCNSVCNPPPVITCNGSASVSASGGTAPYTYKWNDSQGQLTATATGLCAGTYCVTVKDASNQSAQTCVTVSDFTPVPGLGNDTALCPGNSVTLTASGGTVYNWNNGVSNGVPFTPASTSTYIVTVSDVSGCTATDDIMITVNSPPTAYAGADQTVCAGISVTLSASGGVSYSWNNGVTDSVPFAPSVTNTYTVTVTGANGCTATDDVVITVNVNVIPFAGPDQSVCAGTAVTLAASGGSGYTWDNGVTDNVPFIPVQSAVYTVTVSDAGGCTASDDLLVTVNPLPVAEAGNNQSLCSGANITLSASGGLTYLWSGGVTDGVPFAADSVSSTVYTVTVTDANSCSATDFVVVTINDYPVVDLGSDTLLCKGESMILDAGNPGASYMWSNGETSQITGVADAGIYWADVANGNCAVSDTVVIFNPPELSLGPDVSLCSDIEVILSPHNPSLSYLWSTGDTSQWIIVDSAGIYRVNAQYMHCRLSDTIEVTGEVNTIYFPTCFTPDNDTENEIFRGYGQGITEYDLKIFTRWGELIFHASDIDIYWDGKINGNKALNGIYVWMADYKTQCTGSRNLRKYGYVMLIK